MDKKIKCIVSSILAMLMLSEIKADHIILINGQSASTEIVDTSGCNVVIVRKGNNVSIKKELIKTIIWRTDTLHYEGYKCDEQAIAPVPYEETEYFKLLVLLDNAPFLEQVFESKSKTAYVTRPLQGNYDIKEFKMVQDELLKHMARETELIEMSVQDLYKEIMNPRSNIDYAFIPRKYNVYKKDLSKSLSQTMVSLVTPYGFKKEAEIYTVLEISILDIKKKELIFNRLINEDGSTWFQSAPTAFTIKKMDQLREEKIQLADLIQNDRSVSRKMTDKSH
jgi:hypothetical protein